MHVITQNRWLVGWKEWECLQAFEKVWAIGDMMLCRTIQLRIFLSTFLTRRMDGDSCLESIES